MTECIVEIAGPLPSWAQPIVRCRDCRHFNDYHNKCHRQQGVIVVLGDIVRIDEQKEKLILTDAEPDGFCAWAIRRDA